MSWPKLDKRLHLEAGVIIAFFAAIYFASDLHGLYTGFIAGAIKELIDHIRYRGADLKDFLFTALGSIIGSALFII